MNMKMVMNRISDSNEENSSGIPCNDNNSFVAPVTLTVMHYSDGVKS